MSLLPPCPRNSHVKALGFLRAGAIASAAVLAGGEPSLRSRAPCTEKAEGAEGSQRQPRFLPTEKLRPREVLALSLGQGQH